MLTDFRKTQTTLPLFVLLLMSFLFYGFTLSTYAVDAVDCTYEMNVDTLPVKAEQTGLIEVKDTVYTYNPETYEEMVQITRRMITKEAYAAELKSKERVKNIQNQLDTILLFDPANMSETLIVKNLQTGKSDTLYKDQPVKLKKGEKIMTEEQLRKSKAVKKKGKN